MIIGMDTIKNSTTADLMTRKGMRLKTTGVRRPTTITMKVMATSQRNTSMVGIMLRANFRIYLNIAPNPTLNSWSRQGMMRIFLSFTRPTTRTPARTIITMMITRTTTIDGTRQVRTRAEDNKDQAGRTKTSKSKKIKAKSKLNLSIKTSDTRILHMVRNRMKSQQAIK